MKPTPTQWLLTVASLIAIGVTLLGCWKVPRRTVDEGVNRPVLSIAKVKAGHLVPYRGREHVPLESPLLEVSFKNDGNTSAQLTKVEPKVDLLSGGCDLRLSSNEKVGTNIEIPPGHISRDALIGVKVRSPCKTSGVIKLIVVYTNVSSGVEYIQEVSAPVELSFGDQPPQE